MFPRPQRRSRFRSLRCPFMALLVRSYDGGCGSKRFPGPNGAVRLSANRTKGPQNRQSQPEAQNRAHPNRRRNSSGVHAPHVAQAAGPSLCPRLVAVATKTSGPSPDRPLQKKRSHATTVLTWQGSCRTANGVSRGAFSTVRTLGFGRRRGSGRRARRRSRSRLRRSAGRSAGQAPCTPGGLPCILPPPRCSAPRKSSLHFDPLSWEPLNQRNRRRAEKIYFVNIGFP